MDHVETVSVELVDFRNTCFNDSVHQSKAESRNENSGLNGGTIWRDFDLVKLSHFHIASKNNFFEIRISQGMIVQVLLCFH